VQSTSLAVETRQAHFCCVGRYLIDYAELLKRKRRSQPEWTHERDQSHSVCIEAAA
jgi:hypothetical protein